MTTDRIVFQSFSSGSCGNCYFLHVDGIDGGAGILIDAGVSMRRLKQELLRSGFTFDNVDGVLITHDHMDHIHNLGPYCKRMLKPVWMTGRLRRSLATHWMTGPYLAGVVHQLSDCDEWNEIVPGSIRAKYFIVPHDATQTVGYCIDLKGYLFTIMTDIGRMTDEAIGYAAKSATVVIEANYDLEMLRGGSYPVELQDRICGGHGHLSNAECAEALREFLHPGLRNVFLCHLSEHNNTPQKAVAACSPVLEGSKVRLAALPRQSASPLFIL
ncbi:MAG: MBL fold metallo-hydrolase [Bacteroidales bacterium]|nr:MBL fold metallo-hydrolase [Bacteroidales bacterium]